MASNIKLKNNLGTEFTITHTDGSGATSLTSEQLANSATINVDNIANGTIPISDPLVSGVIWANAGILTVRAG